MSFSESGDLLSQWIAYGRKSGFSLAFKSLWRKEKCGLVCKDGFRTVLRRVIYDPVKQRERLRFVLEKFVKLVNSFSCPIDSTRGNTAHSELSILLILEITDWVCSVKHHAFAAEHEWRIITYPRRALFTGKKAANFKGKSGPSHLDYFTPVHVSGTIVKKTDFHSQKFDAGLVSSKSNPLGR